MEKNTLADRLNQIIREQKISKAEFARRMGISRNYIYLLTGGTGKFNAVSGSMAKLIEKEFGYPSEWVLTGVVPVGNLSKEVVGKVAHLSEEELRSVAAYLETLKGGNASEGGEGE